MEIFHLSKNLLISFQGRPQTTMVCENRTHLALDDDKLKRLQTQVESDVKNDQVKSVYKFTKEEVRKVTDRITLRTEEEIPIRSIERIREEIQPYIPG